MDDATYLEDTNNGKDIVKSIGAVIEAISNTLIGKNYSLTASLGSFYFDISEATIGPPASGKAYLKFCTKAQPVTWVNLFEIDMTTLVITLGNMVLKGGNANTVNAESGAVTVKNIYASALNMDKMIGQAIENASVVGLAVKLFSGLAVQIPLAANTVEGNLAYTTDTKKFMGKSKTGWVVFQGILPTSGSLVGGKTLVTDTSTTTLKESAYALPASATIGGMFKSTGTDIIVGGTNSVYAFKDVGDTNTLDFLLAQFYFKKVNNNTTLTLKNFPIAEVTLVVENITNATTVLTFAGDPGVTFSFPNPSLPNSNNNWSYDYTYASFGATDYLTLEAYATYSYTITCNGNKAYVRPNVACGTRHNPKNTFVYKPQNGNNRYVGTSVAVSADGTTVVAGCPLYSTTTMAGTTDWLGGVFLSLAKASNGPMWSAPGISQLSDNWILNGRFGQSIALNELGNIILVGAPRSGGMPAGGGAPAGPGWDTGGVYAIYPSADLTWPNGTATSPMPPATKAENSTSNWDKQYFYTYTNALEKYGAAVAINSKFLAMGAPKSSTAGSNAGMVEWWNYRHKYRIDAIWESANHKYSFRIGPAVTNALFGSCISIGNTYLVVGAPGSGQVYVVDMDNAYPLTPANLEAECLIPYPRGAGVSLAERWGESVSFSSCGRFFAAGAPGLKNGSGQVVGGGYIYRRAATGSAWELAYTITNLDAVLNTDYGFAISIADRFCIIGAPKFNSNKGRCEVLVCSAAWGEAGATVERISLDGQTYGFSSGASFGYAVSIAASGTCIVGAPNHVIGSYTEGAFVVFNGVKS